MPLDIVSCRESGNSPYDLGYLSVMEKGERVPIALNYIRSLPDEVGILVSGYNMPDTKAEESYGVLTAGLENVGIRLHWIGFTWPTGKGYSWVVPDITSWFNRDSEKTVVMGRASNSGQIMRTFFQLLKTHGKRVVLLQTHSLGARVALKALNEGDVECDHLILSAPAVDANSLETGEEFSKAAYNCRSFTVACSMGDSVLKNLYRFSNFGFDQALGLKGPRSSSFLPPNVRTFDFSDLVKGHSEYRNTQEYYQVIKSVLLQTAPVGYVNKVAKGYLA